MFQTSLCRENGIELVLFMFSQVISIERSRWYSAINKGVHVLEDEQSQKGHRFSLSYAIFFVKNGKQLVAPALPDILGKPASWAPARRSLVSTEESARSRTETISASARKTFLGEIAKRSAPKRTPTASPRSWTSCSSSTVAAPWVPGQSR